MRYASYSKKRDYIGFFTAWHCIYYFGELLYCFICLLIVIWKLDSILSLKINSEPFKLFPVKDWSVMLFCLRLVLLAHLLFLLILNIGCLISPKYCNRLVGALFVSDLDLIIYLILYLNSLFGHFVRISIVMFERAL